MYIKEVYDKQSMDEASCCHLHQFDRWLTSLTR